MTLTIPISRFRRLLFAVLQAIAPARASAAAHAQLSQLYDRWGTAVFRAAYAYLHNKSDAEDVLQDTFLQYMYDQKGDCYAENAFLCPPCGGPLPYDR